MATAVVDASVALKWQLDDEEHVEQALALRDDFVKGSEPQLCAPSLWVYELVNGLAVAARQGRIRQADAVDGLRDILALGVEEKRPNPVRIYPWPKSTISRPTMRPISPWRRARVPSCGPGTASFTKPRRTSWPG